MPAVLLQNATVHQSSCYINARSQSAVRMQGKGLNTEFDEAAKQAALGERLPSHNITACLLVRITRRHGAYTSDSDSHTAHSLSSHPVRPSHCLTMGMLLRSQVN